MRNFNNFDAYCLNKECLQSSNSFFNWSETNEHIVNLHNCQNIDPLTYSKIFRKEQDLVPPLKKYIANQLQTNITKISDQISKFIKEKNFTKKINAGLEYIDSLQNNTVTEFTHKMKKGNMVLLRQMADYKHQSSNMTIKKYLSTKIQEKYKEINQEIEKDKQQIILLINIFIEDKRQFKQLIQVAKQLKAYDKSKTLNIIKIEEESMRQQFEKEEPNQKNEKMKRIKKRDKPIKHKQSNNISSYIPFPQENVLKKQQNQIKPEIQEQNTLIVKQPLEPNQALLYISLNHHNIEIIHIFSHKFATKQNIQKVIRLCKRLRILTFNCAHEFDQSLIDQFSNQQLEQIQTLDLKWQFNDFFNEYHIYRYFQSKKWVQYQHTDRIIISVQNLKKLSNNNSLCINSSWHAKKLNSQFSSFDKIKTLHYHLDSKMKQHSGIEFISKFKNLTNLRTLDLKCISLKDSQKYFSVIIENNKNLQKILIKQCTDLPNMDRLLSCLQSLPELTYLSLQSAESKKNITISPKTMFSLTQLTSLHLYKITFINLKTYQNSSSLKQIYNLRRLTHLSVYACIPVFSDLFTYLHQDCIQNLILLNAGFTSVDNKISQSIIKMKSLQYLNIQNNDLYGQAMVQAFKSYFEIHKIKSSLRYFAFEQIRYTECKNKHPYKWRFTIENIKEIGQYLPSLQFLSAYKNYNLNTYDFAQYQALRILTVDSIQQASLRGRTSASVQIFISHNNIVIESQ